MMKDKFSDKGIVIISPAATLNLASYSTYRVDERVSAKHTDTRRSTDTHKHTDIY